MSNITINGAAENGDGIIELTVATDGSVSATPGIDKNNQQPSNSDLASKLADGTTVTASGGKLSTAGASTRVPTGTEYEFFDGPASTALNPNKLMSEIALDGLDTGAFTLANNATDGKEKWIFTSTGGNAAAVTVTGNFISQGNIHFGTITFTNGCQGVRMFWEASSSRYRIVPAFGDSGGPQLS